MNNILPCAKAYCNLQDLLLNQSIQPFLLVSKQGSSDARLTLTLFPLPQCCLICWVYLKFYFVLGFQKILHSASHTSTVHFLSTALIHLPLFTLANKSPTSAVLFLVILTDSCSICLEIKDFHKMQHTFCRTSFQGYSIQWKTKMASAFKPTFLDLPLFYFLRILHYPCEVTSNNNAITPTCFWCICLTQTHRIKG